MTEIELKNYLKTNFSKEDEGVEWKDFSNLKHNVSGRKSEDIISYISAISNQEGGFLIVGIEDKTLEIKGIQDFHDYNLENICARILGNISGLHDLKIKEFKTTDTSKTVWIFEIPKHKPRTHIITHNSFYLRKGDTLIDKGDELEHKKQEILKEDLEITKYDWSAQPCEGAKIEDLDEEALKEFRNKLIAKNAKLKNKSNRDLLVAEDLLVNGEPTFACFLFLGKYEKRNKFLSSELNIIHYLYEDLKNEIEERMDVEIPWILNLPKLFLEIEKRNFTIEDIDLFRPTDKQYDSKAVEEAVVNAIAHRDWKINFWIDVRQTPKNLSIHNPGYFQPDFQKVVSEGVEIPYKNPHICNFLKKIDLMEKERRGIKRKIYKPQISKGLIISKKQTKGDGNQIDKVTFIMDGKMKNIEFAKLMYNKQSEISFEQILILDKIASGKNQLGVDINMEEFKKVSKYINKGRGRSRVLKFKSFLPKIDSNILIETASMKTLEQHILDYARDKKDKNGKYKEFLNSEIYNRLPANKSTIRTVLQKLCQNNYLIKVKNGVYILNNNNKTAN